MWASELQISPDERALLLRVMAEVQAGRAFFSLGEMTTITSWSQGQLAAFVAVMAADKPSISLEEQRFVGHTLYAWGVAVRHGRCSASAEDVRVAEQLHDRCRANRPR